MIEPLNINPYMKGFLRNLYLRPSCHNCPAKFLKSGADITIADYWAIQNVLPELDDDKGISLVMVNTEKGKAVYSFLDKIDRETSYTSALAGNSSIEKSALPHKKRALFFERWHSEPVIPLINKLARKSIHKRFKELVTALLRKTGLLRVVKSCLKKTRIKRKMKPSK